MKKLLVVLMGCMIVIPSFSYTSLESSIADYLAKENIIQDHRSEVSKYRLDDKISRQEVVALAMKINGSNPDGYCRGYFADVRNKQGQKDGWVCPIVEAAADQGFITRSNKNFRPKAFITKAEALSILLKAGGVPIVQNPYMSGEVRPLASLYPFTVPQWQIDVMEAADANGLLSIHVRSVSPEKVFQPNKLATRAEVFGFAYQVMLYRDDVNPQDSQTTQDDQNTMAGIFQDNGNGTSTYLSYPKDFLITLPADTIHNIEEEMLSSDGSGSVTGVSGYIDSNQSKIVFVVGRDSCPGQCTPQFTQQAIQEFQQSARQDGQNISDLGNMMFAISGNDVSGYIKVVPGATAIYYVLVMTERQYSNENNNTMMQILTSFRNR